MAERLTFNEISKHVRDRALALSEANERGENVLADIPRETRKKLIDVIDEVDKLWRQGKSVQRRAQTVLAPLTWQAQTGIEPEKLDIGTARDLEDLMQEGYTPQWSELLNIAAHSLLGSYQMHGRLTEQSFLAAIQLPFVALFIYMAARRFGTPSVFELRDNLAEKLILTDTDAVKPGDVQLPLPGFYVQMPPGALELWNQQTGWHRASFVGVAEAGVRHGPRAGRSLLSIFWCEPNERSSSATDDNAQVSFVSLPEGGTSIEAYESAIDDDLEAHERRAKLTRRPFVRWQGQELGFEEGFKLLRKFVVNFCLYLSSPNPDIQPTGGKQTWKDVIDKAEDARKAGPHARRQVTIGKNFSLWDVGRRVHKIQRTLTATDILVRGHWRPQAHGPRWSLRKVIWIEPFVRRPTGAEAEGHEYKVTENPDDDPTPNPKKRTSKSKRTSRPTRSHVKPEHLTIEDLEHTCGPAETWHGRCATIAEAASKLVGRPRVRGHYHGPVGEGFWEDRSGLPFIQHEWVDLGGGDVLDPTRWSFEGEAPYIHIGPTSTIFEGVEYSEGGDAFRAASRRAAPAPDHGDSTRQLVFETVAVAKRIEGMFAPGDVKRLGKSVSVTMTQGVWLANLPYGELGDDVVEVYQAIRNAKGGAWIPFDNARRAEREGGKLKSNDPRLLKIATQFRERLTPIIGAKLAFEASNNMAGAFASVDEDDALEPVDAVRASLEHRMRYPGTYASEHLTQDMIERSVEAVADMTL